MTPTTWPTMSTAQRVTAISSLAAMRLSTRTMAARLGTSRNAVIGLARRNRIGLCQSAGNAPVGGRTPPAPKPKPKPAPTPAPIQVRKPSWLTYKVYPMPPEETWAPLQGAVVVATTSARTRCKWPSTEPCHHPRSRGSYCATHGAMAYAPKGGEAGYAEFVWQAKINKTLQETSIGDVVADVVPREKMEGVE